MKEKTLNFVNSPKGIVISEWVMVCDTGTRNRFILKQRQRCAGIMPMIMEIISCCGRCHKYSISNFFQGKKKKKKRLNSLTVGYLSCLLTGSVLQVPNCLRQSFPNEIRQFFYLLSFFASTETPCLLLSQWERNCCQKLT